MSSENPTRVNKPRIVKPNMVRNEDNTPTLEEELNHLNTYDVPKTYYFGTKYVISQRNSGVIPQFRTAESLLKKTTKWAKEGIR